MYTYRLHVCHSTNRTPPDDIRTHLCGLSPHSFNMHISPTNTRRPIGTDTPFGYNGGADCGSTSELCCTDHLTHKGVPRTHLCKKGFPTLTDTRCACTLNAALSQLVRLCLPHQHLHPPATLPSPFTPTAPPPPSYATLAIHTHSTSTPQLCYPRYSHPHTYTRNSMQLKVFLSSCWKLRTYKSGLHHNCPWEAYCLAWAWAHSRSRALPLYAACSQVKAPV